MKYLDYRYAADIARDVIDILGDEGYEDREIIPGLLLAVVALAEGDEDLLNEIMSYLAEEGNGEVRDE